MNNMLQQLVMMKIKQNMEQTVFDRQVKIKELAIQEQEKKDKAVLDEKRKYTADVKQKDRDYKEKNRRVTVHHPGKKIKRKVLASEVKKYTDQGWMQGQPVGPQTVVNVGDVGKKQTARDLAKLKGRVLSPQFRDDVTKAFKTKNPDWEIMAASDRQQGLIEEADRRVKDVFPDAKLKRNSETGEYKWVDKNGKIIRPANLKIGGF